MVNESNDATIASLYGIVKKRPFDDTQNLLAQMSAHISIITQFYDEKKTGIKLTKSVLGDCVNKEVAEIGLDFLKSNGYYI